MIRLTPYNYPGHDVCLMYTGGAGFGIWPFMEQLGMTFFTNASSVASIDSTHLNMIRVAYT